MGFARLRPARAVLYGGAMRLSTCLLPLVLLVGCASDASDEIDPACQQGAELIELCAGAVPDAFYQACEDDPTRAEELTAAECPADMGKSDGWLGWKEHGERCWFNWECGDGLECRPLEYEVPSDQVCLEPGREKGRAFAGDWCGDWCDDDDDCADGLLCRNEEILANGMCVSPDHEVERQAICSVDFH